MSNGEEEEEKVSWGQKLAYPTMKLRSKHMLTMHNDLQSADCLLSSWFSWTIAGIICWGEGTGVREDQTDKTTWTWGSQGTTQHPRESPHSSGRNLGAVMEWRRVTCQAMKASEEQGEEAEETPLVAAWSGL